MSKERELLKEVMSHFAAGEVAVSNGNFGVLAATLYKIQELLAQPEQESKIDFRGLRSNGDSYSPEQIEESPPYDMKIHDNPDALAWTRFFRETNPDCNVDDDAMLCWFANAMMAMHDHTYRKYSQPKREPLSEEATTDMFHAYKQARIASCYWAGIRDEE